MDGPTKDRLQQEANREGCKQRAKNVLLSGDLQSFSFNMNESLKAAPLESAMKCQDLEIGCDMGPLTQHHFKSLHCFG